MRSAGVAPTGKNEYEPRAHGSVDHEVRIIASGSGTRPGANGVVAALVESSGSAPSGSPVDEVPQATRVIAAGIVARSRRMSRRDVVTRSFCQLCSGKVEIKSGLHSQQKRHLIIE